MKDKKIANFRVKRNMLIGSVITCIAITTIGIGIMHLKVAKNANIFEAKNKQEETQAITIRSREKNLNNYVAIVSEDNIEVPVPKGYVASPDVEERYVNGVTIGGVREHHGGFVIYERLASDEEKTDEQVQQVINENLDVAQRTRNQWVWVPIDSTEATDGRMYKALGGLLFAKCYNFSESGAGEPQNGPWEFEPYLITNRNSSGTSFYDYDELYLKQYMEGISRSNFLQEMREEFYEMIISVKTYGGFYIGRYSTGNLNKNNAKIVKMQTGTTSSRNTSSNNINFITWYKAYTKSRTLRGTNPVSTNLIWGIQWDETLKWLIASGEKTATEINNSTSWGNYKNASFTYTDLSGTTRTKSSNEAILIPTGSTEYTKANNIYDLAGNLYEWTMAYCRSGTYGNDGRILRSTGYESNGNGGPVGNRWGRNPSDSISSVRC